jgi:hypothetical protein
MLDAPAGAGTRSHSRDELSTPVHRNCGRRAKRCHQVGDEGVRARAGLHVESWACLLFRAANRSALAPKACLSAISASGEGMKAIVESRLFVGDVALVNQDRGLVAQNGGSLTARFAGGASSGRGISDDPCSCLLRILKSVLPYVKVGKNWH